MGRPTLFQIYFIVTRTRLPFPLPFLAVLAICLSSPEASSSNAQAYSYKRFTQVMSPWRLLPTSIASSTSASTSSFSTYQFITTSELTSSPTSVIACSSFFSVFEAYSHASGVKKSASISIRQPSSKQVINNKNIDLID
uniref:Secreted protein n=1 Tax=Echinococcus granulosus TaxID=6210 RepID=A0A068X2V4_ECHGR|nr:hypothetical protein EgrG_002063200 [Echinococcus granulosus]